VKTLSPPRRFTVIWFFAAANVKTAAILDLEFIRDGHFERAAD
jgi:hypothetical protein